MRIFLASAHRYPARDWRGAGRSTRTMPSSGPQLIHDLIAHGLAESGHRVFYQVDGADAEPPPGITLVDSPPQDVDIYHNAISETLPWVYTMHRLFDEPRPVPPQWVFVSETLAGHHGSTRYVCNGMDPQDFLYSETKDRYLLFLAGMQGNTHKTKYHDKGLDIALDVAERAGAELVVAGTAQDEATLNLVTDMCTRHGATYLGDVRGQRKQELLAGARALIFPTRLREGCPLVLIEAMFSGTPVLAADIGVCREMVTPEVGFLCKESEDYIAALSQLDRIQPKACRERAETHYHYRTMAAGYLEQYARSISQHRDAVEAV
ncbi:MAG: glycosyltransferase [Acidobacteriota bacterium]|nr:glycosyltransferase [Acidobacteriota bacterium]